MRLTRDQINKVIVFSTWKDVLDLLSHALTANHLPHLYPKTGQRRKFEEAVHTFQFGDSHSGTPAPRVLLLMSKQGGNGLNLQEANHVVLVEPALDPAIEAQAIGRVDRMGQRHSSTHVHRFVVSGTVEENVNKLCQDRASAMDLSAAAVKRGSGSHGVKHAALTVKDVAVLLKERHSVPKG